MRLIHSIKALLAPYFTLAFIKQQLKDNLYGISLYCKKAADVLALFFVVRFLSIYEYGLYSSYVTIAGFLLLPSLMGYGEYILVSSKKEIKQVILKSSLFMIIAFIVLGCGIIFSLFYPIEIKLIFILVLFRLFFENTIQVIILPYFQAENKFNIISITNIIYSFGLILSAALTYFMNWGLVTFLCLCIILGIISFIYLSIQAKTKYLSTLINLKEALKSLDKSLLGYVCSYILTFFEAQIPALFVALHLSREEAALYFAATAVVSVLHIIFAAKTYKMLPEFIGENLESCKESIKRNILFLTLVTLGFLVSMAILGKWLLLIFYGQSYYEQTLPLILILASGTLLSCVSTPILTYLMAINKIKTIVNIRIFSILCIVATLISFPSGEVQTAIYAFCSVWVGQIIGSLFALKITLRKERGNL